MKLYLLSALLLLVPLVAADLPAPAIKLLYHSDGHNDFVIGEAYDPRKIVYRYYMNRTQFSVSNESVIPSESASMTLRGDLRKQNASIALVYYPSNKTWDSDFCLENTEKHLWHLIDFCDGRIALRNLTEQESQQVLAFKESFFSSESFRPFSQVVHLKKQITTRSSGFERFSLTASKKRYTNGERAGEMTLSTDYRKPSGVRVWKNYFRLNQEDFSNHSFVIESLPLNTDFDCHDTDPADLKPSRCYGDLRLRRPVPADLSAPSIKLLYRSDADGDFVISDGYDPREILYFYYDNQSHFSLGDKSPAAYDCDLMTIKGDLRKQNVSFAMLSYPFNKRYNYDKEFCVQTSEKHLRGLIDWCIGEIVLRNLTEQENQQLLTFKEEQKKKNEPSFKLLHRRKQITTKSAGFKKFHVTVGEPYGMDETGWQLALNADYYKGTKPRYCDFNYRLIQEDFSNRSFVIESLPLDTGFDCRQADPADLKPSSCYGDVHLRLPKEDD